MVSVTSDIANAKSLHLARWRSFLLETQSQNPLVWLYCRRCTSSKLQRPQGYTRTLLTVSWMISAFVMSLTFSGLVLTNLLLRKAPKIDSIQDLVEDSDVQPVVEFQSSIYGAFRVVITEMVASAHAVRKAVCEALLRVTWVDKTTIAWNAGLIFGMSYVLFTIRTLRWVSKSKVTRALTGVQIMRMNKSPSEDNKDDLKSETVPVDGAGSPVK
ncbi:glutamate receptor [Trichonephila clavipes]|nr:glutamate receptor [Trichonephila clavipes]